MVTIMIWLKQSEVVEDTECLRSIYMSNLNARRFIGPHLIATSTISKDSNMQVESLEIQ
jgi:hypothetical protein